MTQRRSFVMLLMGVMLGVGGTSLGQAWATRAAMPVPVSPPIVSPPIKVTLHRFDLRPGAESALREWLAYLAANHREAIATLDRERMYLEAKFTLPDDPRRLYWLTVEGEGGRPVETSDSELDRRHIAYMKQVLVDGSHRRARTRDVLMPDFIAAAIHDHEVVR